MNELNFEKKRKKEMNYNLIFAVCSKDLSEYTNWMKFIQQVKRNKHE